MVGNGVGELPLAVRIIREVREERTDRILSLTNRGEIMQPKKILFLVNAKARHGKDTLADGLVRITSEIRGDGITFIKKSYAKKLKDIATLLGWNGEKDDPGRALLQDIGTGARRYDNNVWVNLLLRELETGYLEHGAFPPFVVISDCRYVNEINFAREWGERNGYEVHAVRVVRPDFDNGLSEEARAHSSETALDDYPFDFILVNDAPSEEAFQNEAWASWTQRNPHVQNALLANWGARGVQIINGEDERSIRELADTLEGPVVTIDFDDTLLEKTGTVDRTPFFSLLGQGGASLVVVSARNERAEDIEAFALEHGIPVKGIIYNAGTKEDILDILRPVCHFDDDPNVAESAFRAGTKTPVFTIGEFSSPDYRELWVRKIEENGEEEFYAAHSGGLCAEDIARGRGAVGTDPPFRRTGELEPASEVCGPGLTI